MQMLLLWVVLGATVSFTGCAAAQRFLERNPNFTKAVAGAAEKGAALGAGAATERLAAGDWQAGGAAGVGGFLLGLAGAWMRSTLKNGKRKDGDT